MNRAGPAEGHHRRRFGIAAAFRDVHAHGRRHGFVDHVVNRPGRLQGGAPLRRADVPFETGRRSRIVERHGTAREVTGIEISQCEIGIRHCRPVAALTVTDRPRIGAGTLRPDLHDAHLVNTGDTAAARPDLDHIDRRHADGKSARLGEIVSSARLPTRP